MSIPHDTTIPDGYKRCSRGDECVAPGGPILSFSEFHKSTSAKDGFQYRCRYCAAKAQGKKVKPRYNVPQGCKRCSSGNECLTPGGPILPATTEYFHMPRIGKQEPVYGKCRLCKIDYDHLYVQTPKAKNWSRSYERSPERRTSRQQRKQTPEYKAVTKAYNDKPERKVFMVEYRNTPKHRAYEKNRNQTPERKMWRAENRKTPKQRARKRLARVRKLNLPINFTAQDWFNCLDVWFACCAYCGHQQGLLSGTKLTADHWIPVHPGYKLETENPGTVKANIVPACLSCNASKGNREPVQWLIGRFGKRKANEILKRVKGYFNSF